MAIELMRATKAKGNKAAMLLDRIVLCDQTSKRLEKYQIDHGVMQAGHWRYRPYEPIQVCSAQTLEKRGTFPGLNLLIVDEAHQTREQTMEFIKNNPDVRVIGLTATPFTKGLGKVYDNVVSTVTTKELVEQKILVPLRVFIAKEIDMTGAKKVAGEWSQQEASTRGMKITGDVVSEWIGKTLEIFGKPMKTIVFASGVDHGVHLARKFQTEGYNFICISYKDDEEWKKKVIEDFSKPDTKIQGLIATDILTKGFDVPDVAIGISARPFSKSLSSHIQQMGRVMRGCEGKEFAVWLDHSGNYLRFREDWEEVFEQGVDELDEGKEKAKKEPSDKVKEDSKCPKCQALWPRGSDTCYNCGHVKEKKNQVIAVQGEMVELTGTVTRESKQDFWNQMVWLMRYQNWNKGRAAHTYKDMFGVWPRNLADNRPKAPSQKTMKFIDKKLREFRKQRRGY
jgi:superfamily II DNA or RNA helicase